MGLLGSFVIQHPKTVTQDCDHSYLLPTLYVCLHSNALPPYLHTPHNPVLHGSNTASAAIATLASAALPPSSRNTCEPMLVARGWDVLQQALLFPFVLCSLAWSSRQQFFLPLSGFPHRGFTFYLWLNSSREALWYLREGSNDVITLIALLGSWWKWWK